MPFTLLPSTAAKPILAAVVTTALAEGAVVATGGGLTEVFWVALVGAAVAIFATLANLIVALRVNRKSDQIVQHTNSINSTLQSSLRDAHTRIELLERLIQSRELGAAAQVAAVDKAVSAALTKPRADDEEE